MSLAESEGLTHGQRSNTTSSSFIASTVVILIIGLAGAFLVLNLEKQEQKRIAQVRFNKMSLQVAMSLRHNISRAKAALTSITALYAGSPHAVTRKEFRAFISMAMSDPVGIQALEWIPRVTDQARETFEVAARKDGMKDFSFRQLSGGGIVTASKRAEYFPVYFVEPLAGNQRALGFDLSSNPVRKAALEQARDTGSIVSSARITLVQETGRQTGVVVFAPIYGKRDLSETVEKNRTALTGFALGVFRVGDLLETSITKAERASKLIFALYDVLDKKNLRPLHLVGIESKASWPSMEELTSGQFFKRKYEFGGRPWQLVIAPRSGIIPITQSWVSWLAASATLLILLLIGFYIQMVVRRSEYAEALVDNRTTELRNEISERRLTEVNLKKRTDDLSRSNKELEQFAYVASHDLQEPLRKVQAFSDLLAAEYSEKIGEEGKGYIDRMQNASVRMRELINDLLTFSRVSTKEAPFTTADLSEIMDEIVSNLEISIKEAGAVIEVAELPVIEADVMQMRQLFQNLIGNALKFKREDVPLVIRVSAETDEGPDVQAKTCRILVEDNGIGFEAKHSKRIFRIFQRLHGRGKVEGSGIGLAICQKICERHGGSIVAEGRKGEGATFSVTLPVDHGKIEEET